MRRQRINLITNNLYVKMKKVAVLLLLLLPVALLAQKAPKPNLNKALNSWKQGNFQEAKEMIDICVSDAKLSLDAKTFFYKGLIYISIDTTSNEAYKALASNSFETAMEAFAKSDEINESSKSELFYTDASGFPVLKSQAMERLAYYYLNVGANAYQNDDLEGALMNFERTQIFLPNDTTAFFYAGFVARSMEDYDKTIQYLTKYNELGGTSADAYSMVINTYSGPKDNKEKALELALEAKAKYPDNTEFPKVEIGLLIDMNKIDKARNGLIEEVKKDPSNKVLQFYLGYVNSKLEKYEEAKVNFNDALKVDPMYFEAQYYLAQLYLIDATIIKQEMDNLGITQADQKKRMTLDKELVEKYKIALPYWEKAEKLNPEDTEVLDKLSIIYYYLGEDAKAERVEKRLKELGVN